MITGLVILKVNLLARGDDHASTLAPPLLPKLYAISPLQLAHVSAPTSPFLGTRLAISPIVLGGQGPRNPQRTHQGRQFLQELGDPRAPAALILIPAPFPLSRRDSDVLAAASPVPFPQRGDMLAATSPVPVTW